MQKKNVYENVEAPLERHEDDRGVIADIFYKSGIDHVAIIKSNAGAVRGNHYHEVSTTSLLFSARASAAAQTMRAIQLGSMEILLEP